MTGAPAMEETLSLHHGDCVEVMRGMPAESVDAIVTDPPYELGFMGRAWDASGIAYSVDLWREALRVLKPGGHLLSSGGTRTYHRMACAIEDAGFEIRDSLHWFYGSGFPKSLDVSKAIQEATRRAASWLGWGTALKPAHEPIVLARKPLAGTVAENVLEHGTGGLNIEACRVVGPPSVGGSRSGNTALGLMNDDGWRPQAAAIDRSMAAGRWPPNLLLTHHPDCSEECVEGCPVAELDWQSGETGQRADLTGEEPSSKTDRIFGKFAGRNAAAPRGDVGGASRFFPTFRWDSVLDVPFAYCAKPSRAERDAGLEDVLPTSGGEATEREDGAAGTRSPRAGAGRSGGSRNFHPTVKPIRLMEWLCRLVTPPGGLVLDPFTGSGTTGCAALRQGFRFLGIEREQPYIEIAVRRIALAAGAPRAKDLGELVRLKPEPVRAQLDLLSGAAKRAGEGV